MGLCHRFCFALLLFSLAGCSLFQRAYRAAEVRTMDAGEVAGCREIGLAEITLRPGSMEDHLNERDITGQLDGLARESAVEMGGNTIVPRGGVDNRTRSYTVYECR